MDSITVSEKPFEISQKRRVVNLQAFHTNQFLSLENEINWLTTINFYNNVLSKTNNLTADYFISFRIVPCAKYLSTFRNISRHSFSFRYNFFYFEFAIPNFWFISNRSWTHCEWASRAWCEANFQRKAEMR